MDVFIGCRFVFEDCEPGEYIYRLEFIGKFPKNPERVKYVRFMEENGVEHVASCDMWIYFRKKASGGSFDIYSDADSRLAHYRRISMFTLIGGLANIAAGCVNIFVGSEEASVINYIAGIICSAIGAGCLIAWNTYRKKIQRLKWEKTLRE